MRRRTGPTKAVRQEVIDRARGRCEKCGTPTAWRFHIHHRQPRQMGGSRSPEINQAPNLLLLCDSCHDWIESHRTESYEQGWLIRRGSIADGSVVMEQGRGT